MEMTLSLESIERYQQSIVANGGSPNTVRSYGADLRGAREWINKTQSEMDPTLAPAAMELLCGAYLNEVQQHSAATTTNRKIASLKSWAKWSGHYRFLTNYRRPIPLPPVPHPIPEGISGIERMLVMARRDTHKALIALQGFCGLRVGECRQVTADWFVFEPEGIWLRVHGKGNKQRLVPVSPVAWSHLVPAWCTAMRTQDQRIVPLTDRAARRAVTRAAERAGLDKDTASHHLRATFATAAWHASGGEDGKKDLRVVQELLGHANSSTTEVYVGNTKKDMQAAVNFNKENGNGIS